MALVKRADDGRGRPKKFDVDFVDNIKRLVNVEGYTRKSVGSAYNVSQQVIKAMLEDRYFKKGDE